MVSLDLIPWTTQTLRCLSIRITTHRNASKTSARVIRTIYLVQGIGPDLATTLDMESKTNMATDGIKAFSIALAMMLPSIAIVLFAAIYTGVL